MKKLDTKSAVPLYLQLADDMRRQTQEGLLAQGEQIMPESAMCAAYGVSRITVRKALDLLVDEKVLFRRQGKGTFVAYPESWEAACIRRQSFTAATSEQSVVPHTKVIGRSIVTLDRALMKKFHIEGRPEERMLCLTRIRYLDKDPAIYETDYLPMRFQALLELELDDRSLYGVIHERTGVTPTDFCDYFQIMPATPQLAGYLETQPGHPLLSVAQTVLDGAREVVYYNEQLIKTESYQYSVRSYLDTE